MERRNKLFLCIIKQKNLHTQDLLLRPLNLLDAHRIYFLRSDPLINHFVKRPAPKNLQEAEAFIQKILDGVSNGRLFYWAICRAEDPGLLGTICLWNFSSDRKIAEIGYDLDPASQKKGIMQAALKRIIQFGWEELKLKQLEAFTHHENRASVALLERNDFVLAPKRRDTDNLDNRIYVLKKNLT